MSRIKYCGNLTPTNESHYTKTLVINKSKKCGEALKLKHKKV